MIRIAKIILVSLLAAALVFMFVFTVCLPRTTESDYSTLRTWPEFSFSALFSGDYFADIAAYFTDTVNSRDRFIDYNTKIKTLYGLKEDETIVGPDNSGGIEDQQPDWTPDASSEAPSVSEGSTASTDESGGTSSEVSSEDPEPDPPAAISGSILIIGKRGMEIFYGNLNNGKVFADTLNEFASKVGSGVNVYSMVVPKAAAYYLSQSETYAKYASRSKENIDNIDAALSENVKSVNVYDILGEHADEEIFFRTDHHWTALAGYYAAKMLAQTAGVPFTDLSQYTETRRSGYVGTLYKYSDYNPTLLNNPEDLVTYIPPSSYKITYFDQSLATTTSHDSFFWEIADDKRSSWYSTFLRGDRYAVKVESDTCKNGRTLLIVKDSYGNVLAPYLVDSFQTVYVVDAREFKLNLYDTVKNLGVTDVLFAESAFSSVGGDYINKIKGLCG